MNKFNKVNSLLWIIITLLALSNAVTVFLLVVDSRQISDRIKNGINSEIAGISIPKPENGKDATEEQVYRAVVEYFRNNPIQDGRDGRDGHTPIKGVDYFDGKDGRNGIDGEAGTDGSNGSDGVNGTDGLDGKTPQLRCNTNKNVWQIRYSNEEAWQNLNGEKVACTIGISL